MRVATLVYVYRPVVHSGAPKHVAPLVRLGIYLAACLGITLFRRLCERHDEAYEARRELAKYEHLPFEFQNASGDAAPVFHVARDPFTWLRRFDAIFERKQSL